MDETPNEQPEASASSESEGLNQEDVDALMNGAGSVDDSVAGDGGAAAAPDDGDPREIGQDDIDALVAGGGEQQPAAKEETAQPDTAVPVNQEDVDALVSAGADMQAAASDAAAAPVVDASEAISQDDIDVLQDAAADSKSEAGGEKEPDGRVDSLGRPFDEMAAAMQAAIEEEKSGAARTGSAAQGELDVTGFDIPEFGDSSDPQVDTKSVSMLNDVNLHVKLQLGRTEMLVEDVLKLGEGSVVELDKLAGDPVDVLVNDRLIARGEVLVLNDVFCVRVSEVVASDPHRVTT